ncbi:MAG: M23 family metallopeptidase [Actinobacteria bacterium]|nr:M23 family metallopeptidase [Actinomycetota bacterium]
MWIRAAAAAIVAMGAGSVANALDPGVDVAVEQSVQARPENGPDGVANGNLFVAPTAAPIADRFDHDAGAYGPGNRGLDFATAPGERVWAIGDGVVVFAGPVAGKRWVTVAHPNGLRSTVGPLQRIDVAPGESVRLGQPLGTVASTLHLSIRDGDRYLDPEPLLALGRVRAILVPAQKRAGAVVESAGGAG